MPVRCRHANAIARLIGSTRAQPNPTSDFHPVVVLRQRHGIFGAIETATADLMTVTGLRIHSRGDTGTGHGPHDPEPAVVPEYDIWRATTASRSNPDRPQTHHRWPTHPATLPNHQRGARGRDRRGRAARTMAPGLRRSTGDRRTRRRSRRSPPRGVPCPMNQPAPASHEQPQKQHSSGSCTTTAHTPSSSSSAD